MEVSAKKFFNQIELSILYDIENSTGKKIKPYEGFKYKKVMKNKLGRKGDVEVFITKFNPPIVYAAEFKSINGINKINYTVNEIGENSIEVFYSEFFEGNTRYLDMNFKLMKFFYKRSAKKRAIQMLKRIENYINQNL